jgi:hypothetical protein
MGTGAVRVHALALYVRGILAEEVYMNVIASFVLMSILVALDQSLHRMLKNFHR